MNRTATRNIPALVLSALLAACAGPRQPGVAGPVYETPDVIVGAYASAGGTRATIRRDETSAGYLLDVQEPGDAPVRTYPAFVRVVGPKDARSRLLEIEVGEGAESGALVFTYGALTLGPGAPTTWLEYRPLRAEWLRAAAGDVGRVRFEALPGGEGEGIVIGDHAHMVSLLERAAADPGALGAAELWNRAP